MAPTEDDIRRVYRDTIDDLYAFVSRRSDGDRDLAEDVTQDTWLRALKAWRADGLPERPLAWLTTVAARLLSNHRRRPATDPLPDEGALPAAEPRGDGDRSLITRALERLPAIQARLLEAFHFERQSVASIAATHGLTVRGAEGRLRRARQQLRREIERDPEGDRT